MIDETTLLADLRSAAAALRFPDPADPEGLLRTIPRAMDRRRTMRRRLAFAVVLACIALAGVPGVRRAVADTLGLGGVRIRIDPTLDLVQSPVVADLGSVVSVAKAEAVLGVTLPQLPGEPDPLVLLRSDTVVPAVTMVWPPSEAFAESSDTRVGLLLMLFRGTVERAVVEKVVQNEAQVVNVTVGGRPGVFVGGGAHAVGLIGPDGERWEDAVRLSANTLLWEVEGVTYRLEGAGTMGAMIALAESLR